MTTLLFLTACGGSSPLATRTLKPLDPVEQGAERERRGTWAVFEVNPDRRVLQIEERQYALTSSGPHQVALPVVSEPHAAWISVPDDGPWGLFLDGKQKPSVLLVEPPETFVQGALTDTHAIVGSVLEPQGVLVVVVDLATGRQVDFPSVEQERSEVVAISPDGRAIATKEWGTLRGRIQLDVHQGDRRTHHLEVSGVTPIEQALDQPVPLVLPPSLGGHAVSWTRKGDQWTIAQACDGCTLQRLPD